MPNPYPLQLRSSFDSLLSTVALLEPSEIDGAQMQNGWTPISLLAHIVFWDDVQRARMEDALSGRSTQVGYLSPLDGNDERAAQEGRAFNVVMAEAEAARKRLIAFAEGLEPAILERDYPEGDQRFSLDGLLAHIVEHTRRHTADLYAWCGSMKRWNRATLRALLETQYRALMDSVAGLDEQTIVTRRAGGEWTLREVLIHVLTWDEFSWTVVKAWPAVSAAEVDAWTQRPDESLDDQNARLMTQRAHLNMIEIADGLATCHRRILRRFDAFSDAELSLYGETGTGSQSELSCFIFEICHHQAEHALEIWLARP